MVEGRTDNRWVKGGKEIIFGLHERGKPPTLICPRPDGVYTDDEINRILKIGDFAGLLADIEKRPEIVRLTVVSKNWDE